MNSAILYSINRWEGGAILTDHSADKGGKTKYGISSAAYPHLDIENLTLEEAHEIMLRDYWRPLRVDEITSPKIRWKIFDMGLNLGTVTSAFILQKAVGANADGMVGTETLTKTNSLDELTVLVTLGRLQAMRYAKIVKRDNSQIVFLFGWLERAFDLGLNLPTS